jgi:hypothetical protein
MGVGVQHARRTGAEAWQRFEYFRSALWEVEEVPDVVERVEV